MPFSGFPSRVRFVPVPGPMFGPVLEEIDDLAELKCTLRVIWLLHHKRGYPKFVTFKELRADRTLARALAFDGSSHGAQLEGSLARAVERGTLRTASIGQDGGQQRIFVLNTEPYRKALETMLRGDVDPGPLPNLEPWEGAVERPNIFGLYEDNIGMMTPMIADELREAEQLYTGTWIEEAFREAVGHNKRSWRYITRILERWEREGKSDGESRRYPKKAGYY